MARPKEFDREEALERAIPVFWRKGFAGAAIDDLVRATGVGRQSLYDTFGDKRGLFLQALRAYHTGRTAAVFKELRRGPTALLAIERLLLRLTEVSQEKRSLGCMGVNATCELAGEDAEVRAVNEASGALLEATLAAVVDEGKAAGVIRRGIDSRAAARFLAATLSGMRVQAKAGASVKVLRDVAAFAAGSLRPRSG